ncbi:MAG TPA: DUF2752 domain-containing protein, partial [Caulifigura sp.]|nr:DUF2752 domain-containing protein [Caulifigura sp.]
CGRICAARAPSVHSPLVLEGILAYDTAFRPKMIPFGLPGRSIGLTGRAICLGLAALFLTLLLLAASVRPDPRGYGTHEQLGLTPCAFRVLLKIPCPTCGGTTSFAHFVRGEWRLSFQANSAAFAFACLSTLLIPWLITSAATGRLHGVASADWAFILTVALLAGLTLANWIIRLLPYV